MLTWTVQFKPQHILSWVVIKAYELPGVEQSYQSALNALLGAAWNAEGEVLCSSKLLLMLLNC